MGIKITDMTATSSADGTEIVPTSKAAAPRSVTIEKVKDYVIDSIEAITAGISVAAGNGLFALQSGVLKPVDIDLVTQRAIDIIWGKADATPVGADKAPFKTSGGVEKTMTITTLAGVIRGLIEATILDVSDLATAGALSGSDYFLVTQGTTGKKVTLTTFYAGVYAGLAATVAALTAIPNTADSDVLYAVRSGTGYKITLEQIADHVLASALINGSGSAGLLASWVDSDTLTGAYGVVTDLAAPADTTLPTSEAVTEAMEGIVTDSVDIGDGLADADEILVNDASVPAQRKSALSRIWTWLKAKTDAPVEMIDLDGATDIGAGLADADLILVDDGAGGTNRKSALSRVWTWLKTKTDLPLTMLDIDGGTDIGAALADADLLIVDDGAGGTNRKSTILRVWTYIASKLSSTPTAFPSYTVAGLPAATTAAQIVYVSNETGGAVLAFSDGTNWRRVTDRAVVS